MSSRHESRAHTPDNPDVVRQYAQNMSQVFVDRPDMFAVYPFSDGFHKIVSQRHGGVLLEVMYGLPRLRVRNTDHPLYIARSAVVSLVQKEQQLLELAVSRSLIEPPEPATSTLHFNGGRDENIAFDLHTYNVPNNNDVVDWRYPFESILHDMSYHPPADTDNLLSSEHNTQLREDLITWFDIRSRMPRATRLILESQSPALVRRPLHA